MRTRYHQCPCCDYFTLDARGQYDICPVCFWEDDGLDVDRPAVPSGPNRRTLRAARHTFRQFGACDRAMAGNVVPPARRAAYERHERSLGPPDHRPASP